MLTDTDMCFALNRFLETHPLLVVGPVDFVDEGTFTSVSRMRTLTPLIQHCKHKGAVTLELRGRWAYPMMMMNDCQPLTADPPTILVRDAMGGVLARFKPQTAEDVATVLRNEVYDVDNLERRKTEMEAADRERQRQDRRMTFLMKQRTELNVQLRSAVQSSVARCNEELRALARRLVEQIETHSVCVYTDIDLCSEMGAMQAFEGGVPQAVQAMAREVERLVHLELMGETALPVAC